MKKIILKKSNILTALLLLTLILLIAILFRLKITSINSVAPQNKVEKKVGISKEEYKKNIYLVLGDYENIIKEANIYATSTKRDLNSTKRLIQKIDVLRERVIETKAPSFEYKDLHMNLMLSLLSIKNYLEAPQEKNMLACNDYITKVKRSSSALLE